MNAMTNQEHETDEQEAGTIGCNIMHYQSVYDLHIMKVTRKYIRTDHVKDIYIVYSPDCFREYAHLL